jgi:nucleoside-diphosphate-sugar epimerase
MTTLVAISGSSGFLGSALVRAFESSGFTTVGLDLNEPHPDSAPSHFYRGDIRDAAWCTKLAAGCDIVVHTAASVPLAKSKDVFAVNVSGSANLASAAKDAEVFVHLSSSAVYGRPRVLPVPTTADLSPIEPYGRSKLLAEQAVATALLPGTRLTILRPRTIISPSRGGIFSVLFDAIASGSALPVFGARTTVQFLHLGDCVSAVLMAASPGYSTPILNLGAHSPSPLADHLRELVHDTGSRSKVCVLPSRLASSLATAASTLGLLPFAPWHTKTYGTSHVVDLTESAAAGFVPRFSNYEALLEAYTERSALLGSSPHTTVLDSKMSTYVLRVLSGVSCRR